MKRNDKDTSGKVLVAYASKHGATAEIAEEIGQVLRQADLNTHVMDIECVKDLAPYHAVVLGSAVYIGQWQKQAAKFLQNHETQLAARKVWLFSSGPSGKGNPVDLWKGRCLPNSLQPIAGRIQPNDIAVFHGNLNLEKLGFIERAMIKKVNAVPGDFRDWEAIRAWAAAIVNVLKEN